MPARIYKAPITHLLISLIQREQRHFISPKPFFSLEKKGAVAQREIIIKKKGKPTMTIHHNRLLWTLLYFILFCLAFFIWFFILFYDNDDGDLNNIYYRYDSIIEPISNVYTREPVILPSLLLSVCLSVCLSFSLILHRRVPPFSFTLCDCRVDCWWWWPSGTPIVLSWRTDRQNRWRQRRRQWPRWREAGASSTQRAL